MLKVTRQEHEHIVIIDTETGSQIGIFLRKIWKKRALVGIDAPQRYRIIGMPEKFNQGSLIDPPNGRVDQNGPAASD